MASASKTPNLNLPQWVGTEKPERTDFNAAFDAIDTTVASHMADKAPHVFVGCRVFHSLGQSIAGGTDTVLAFNSTTYDTDVMHDNVVNNDRITIKTAGKYRITAQIEWTANVTGRRLIYFMKNGTAIIGFNAVAPLEQTNRGTSQVISIIYDFIIGDYIQIFVVQESGGALTIPRTNDYSPIFSAERVG